MALEEVALVEVPAEERARVAHRHAALDARVERRAKLGFVGRLAYMV
jgi:hypothetical protein